MKQPQFPNRNLYRNLQSRDSDAIELRGATAAKIGN